MKRGAASSLAGIHAAFHTCERTATVLALTIEKFRLWYRARRFLRRSEPNETRFTCDVVQPGDCVLDVGANKGAYSYWMMRKVGHNGLVLAFEPQRDLADSLQRIANSARHGNMKVCPVALSDQNGSARMVVPGHCWGSLEIKDNSAGHPEVDVALVTLDSYLSETEARRPVAFIKCDVEGHELAVFRGARQILIEDKPILLFETAPLMHIDAEQHPVFCFLRNLGYKGYFFYEGELLPISNYCADLHHLTNHLVQNYVFLHSDACQLTNPQAPYAIERVRGARRRAA